MNTKIQINSSIITLILISLLSGCKKSPESLSVEDSNMSKEQEEAGINKITVVKMREENLVSTTYSPNDVSFSLRVVEPPKSSYLKYYLEQGYKKEPYVDPNSLSEPKDYHYKYLFFPLHQPPFDNPLIDRLYDR